MDDKPLGLQPTKDRHPDDVFVLDCVRLSRLVARHRASGDHAFARKLVEVGKLFVCTDCGRANPDPAVGLRKPDNMILACPHCYSEEVLRAWEEQAPG